MTTVTEKELIDIVKDILERKFELVDEKSISKLPIVELDDTFIIFTKDSKFLFKFDNSNNLLELKTCKIEEDNCAVETYYNKTKNIKLDNELYNNFLENNSYLIHKTLKEYYNKIIHNNSDDQELSINDINITPINMDEITKDLLKNGIIQYHETQQKLLKINKRREFVKIILLIFILIIQLYRFFNPIAGQSADIFKNLILLMLFYLIIK